MKKKYKVTFGVITFIIIFVAISLYFIVGKKGVGRIIDKLGITSDVYRISIDRKIALDTYIYWYGESEYGRRDNKMLFYHRSLSSDIPPIYGDNEFEIKYKATTYDKISFWKEFAYSKYKHVINIKTLGDDMMIIEWNISNWYDNNSYQGVDTIPINKGN